MKTTRIITTRNLLMAGMAAAFCCSVANAQIIYSNDFTHGSPASINGATPTYVNPNASLFGGDTGAAWDVVSNNFTAGFSANQNGTLGSQADSVLLPFTPQNGYIYTMSYSLTLTVAPPGGGWAAIGYGSLLPVSNNYSTGGDRFNDPTVAGNPWALLNYLAQGGGAVLFKTRSSSVGGTANLISSLNTPYTINFVLDTSAADWHTALYIDSTLVKDYTYTGGNPTIASIGYGQTTTTAGAYKWNTFTLSAEAVPEPSTPALIGAGLAMMFLVSLYRNRRNAVEKSIR